MVAAKKRIPAGQGTPAARIKAGANQVNRQKLLRKSLAGKAASGRYRDSTVLVGGHFPPHVLRQLRMIAAEEDTTNQALIAEALDLLFVKKGKGQISDLSVG